MHTYIIRRFTALITSVICVLITTVAEMNSYNSDDQDSYQFPNNFNDQSSDQFIHQGDFSTTWSIDDQISLPPTVFQSQFKKASMLNH